MADSKISALAAITSLGATDEMVVSSGGATKKITGANLSAKITIVNRAAAQSIANNTAVPIRIG